ncbi:MAG: hypothetical protein AABY58_05155 [Nitrospirota bacterium]
MINKQASVAKISLPRLSGIFPRKSLFKLLDKSRSRPVIWIAGPPGAGKTTLIASYLKQRRLPVLWYKIDTGDGDIASFFYYIGLAGKKLAPRRKPLPFLTPEYFPGLPVFTLNFFRNLYKYIKHPGLLIFDNYQDVSLDAHLHEVMQYGLDEIPEGINIIILSRSDPPPAYARLTTYEKMTILNYNDLKLMPEESYGIAKLRCRKRLPMKVIQELHRRTYGWAAGLVLMLEWQKSKAIAKDAVIESTPQVMFDYFAGEVFQRLDHSSQKVLLQTAFLPAMTGKMAEDITGSDHAGRILAELSQKNYFTMKHLNPEPVYQYHPLFREFLLTQAGQKFNSAEIAQIQHGAAAILEKAGDIEEAIALYLYVKDWSAIAPLILKNAVALLSQGRNQVLEQWIRQIPQEMMNKNPWLLYWFGACRMPFNTKEAQDYFESAFELFHEKGIAEGVFMAWAGVVESVIFGYGVFTPVDRWIELLPRLQRKNPSFSNQEIEDRASASMFVALTLRQPHHPELNKYKERARAILQHSANNRLRSFVYIYLLNYCLWTGDNISIEGMIKDIRDLSRSEDIHPLVRITSRVGECWHQMRMARHELSSKAALEGLEIAKATGIHTWDAILFVQDVHNRLSVNDLVTAKDYLLKVSSLFSKSVHQSVSIYHYATCWEAIISRDLQRAEQHGEMALEAAISLGSPFHEAMSRIGFAYALFEQGKDSIALTHLKSAFKLSIDAKSPYFQFMCLICNAYFSITRGNESDGIESLRQAMGIGREQGHLNAHFWNSSIMSMLCAKAIEHNIEVDYVRNLIRKRNLIPDELPLHLNNWPWPLKIYTLGRFEILKDDEPVQFTGKVQRKPLELLKLLIALGGNEVGLGALTDALWPDADGDAAQNSLEITLHRLRKLLGENRAVIRQEDKLTIDRRYIWVDIWALEYMFGLLDDAAKQGEETRQKELIEKIKKLYKGQFLSGHVEPSCFSLREDLHNKYLRLSHL